MSLVLDSSAALAWFFEDEQSGSVRDLLDRVGQAGAVVPSLWRYEVANGLQMAVRRRRIVSTYRDVALGKLLALQIRIDDGNQDTIWLATVRLAEACGLTVYDAAYLELAQRLRLPLATLDGALSRAADQAGLALVLPDARTSP